MQGPARHASGGLEARMAEARWPQLVMLFRGPRGRTRRRQYRTWGFRVLLTWGWGIIHYVSCTIPSPWWTGLSGLLSSAETAHATVNSGWWPLSHSHWHRREVTTPWQCKPFTNGYYNFIAIHRHWVKGSLSKLYHGHSSHEGPWFPNEKTNFLGRSSGIQLQAAAAALHEAHPLSLLRTASPAPSESGPIFVLVVVY